MSDRLYTEREVEEIIRYSCSTQKANDYQIAGNFLIPEKAEDLKSNSILLLDYLAESETDLAIPIIEQINDHLEELAK